MLNHLKAAREGKAYFTLITMENHDAGYVGGRVEALRSELEMVETIAQGCASGGGNKDLCDLAINRNKYFTKVLALQFDAILAERLKAWTTTISRINDNESIAVINYKALLTREAIGKDLGRDLEAIGKVLEQTNTKGTIDSKLDKLHADFVTAVKARSSTNAWAAHATEAKYQDAIVTKAMHTVDGLSLVRVGVNDPSWEIIRGAYDQPTQRNKYVWALLRKSGESFCRLYPLTVIQDHIGGGRYGEARVDAGGVAEFYVSACK